MSTTPLCHAVLGKNPVFQWITKSIAISIAWYIQSIQSAFTSSLIGGLMIARSFCNFCYAHGIGLGGMIKQNHEETVLDEGLSYLFAGLGFYFQFMIGFKVPAPLNLIFWPFNIAEVGTDIGYLFNIFHWDLSVLIHMCALFCFFNATNDNSQKP